MKELIALITALPQCRVGNCTEPATHGYGSGYVCDEHVVHQYPLSYAKELRDAKRKYMSKPKMEKIPLEVGDEATAWSSKTGTCLAVERPEQDVVEVSSQGLKVRVAIEWLPDGTNEITIRTSGQHSRD